MRILSWNCQGRYRDKIDNILGLNPDIAVIQECESLDRIRATCREKIPLKSLWFSEKDDKKGVGIFIYSDYEILGIEYYSCIEYIIPVMIRAEFDFFLFAVWAMVGLGEGEPYTGQVERAINKYYRTILENNESIVIGDFNTFRIHYPLKSGTKLIDVFEDLGMASAYHEHFKKDYEEHSHYTFYQYRKDINKLMLDYCFVSKSLINNVSNVEIGKYEDWKELSDHCPLIIDFKKAAVNHT